MCHRIFKEQTSTNGDIPFYKIGTFGNKADAFISTELFEEYKTKYPYPEKGDILISASGSIGKIIEFTGENEYFQDSNIVWLKHDKRLVNSFLKHFYSIVKWSGIEGSTIKRLYNDNILDTYIHIPSIQEQQCIGSFLNHIDNLINLHQQKLTLLNKYKRGLLRLLFPINNEDVPKLRFLGFTEHWKKVKLKEILKIRNTKNNNKYKKEDILSVSDSLGCVNQIEFYGRSLAGSDISNYKIVQPGDIIYTKSPLHLKPYGIIKIVKNISGIVSPLYIINEATEISDPLFIYYSFDTPKKTNDYLRPLVRRGAKNTMNISNEEWLSGYVKIPSIKEQQKIGSFLDKLDFLIDLHQQRLMLLKKYKTGLLQQMFI